MGGVLGDISSAIGSALTPAGTNARQHQVNSQQNVMNEGNTLTQSLAPTLNAQANYAGTLEPARESAISNALYAASPGNNQAKQQLFGTQAASNAGLAAKEAGAADTDAGLSPAYTAGSNQAIANNAAQATNANWQQMNSPEYQLQQAQGLAAQYQQAMGLPSQSAYQSAANLVYGAPQVPVQPGIGQVLGGIAGQALGDSLGVPSVGSASTASGVTGTASPGAWDTMESGLNALTPYQFPYPIAAGYV